MEWLSSKMALIPWENIPPKLTVLVWLDFSPPGEGTNQGQKLSFILSLQHVLSGAFAGHSLQVPSGGAD